MRLTKILAAAAALAFTGISYAGTISHVSAEPNPALSALTPGGSTRTGLEYVVTTTDPAGTFAAFCLEPTKHYFAPGPETYTMGAFTPAQADELSKLFTGAQWKSWDHTTDGVDQNFEQHGLALAVWDIMIDGTLDFSTGAFQLVSDGAGGNAFAFAYASYAAGNTSMADNLRYLDLRDPMHQDMVIAVPEPSTYAMLLAGLAGVGFVARRRQRRA